MTALPQDPFILLSWANTRLRDQAPSLEALCEDWEVTPDELSRLLAPAGVTYDPACNQFR